MKLGIVIKVKLSLGLIMLLGVGQLVEIWLHYS
jgi:hypothetical protein